MFAQLLARAPEPFGRHFAIPFRFPTRCFALVLSASLVAGCGSAPPGPRTATIPSDPDARVPPAAYRTVVGPYARQRPGDPSAWREQNERIAPEAKP